VRARREVEGVLRDWGGRGGREGGGGSGVRVPDVFSFMMGEDWTFRWRRR